MTVVAKVDFNFERTYHVKYTFPDGGWPVFYCTSASLEKVVKAYLSFPGKERLHVEVCDRVIDLHIENLWRPVENPDYTVKALRWFVQHVKGRQRHHKWIQLAVDDLVKRKAL